eukprot:TRINITY_DN1648_c1_g1_i1.p1 TRINITY_DN1648_c1_g1~~TRINITY_DN1648_c1_g1_i1.p1  ORF type:complete len:679 (+),score=176.54 TRINITY_DN1648_c1_g1_i1:888-2924(+)
MSGRKVDLHIYVQHHNADKCGHALKSLKQSMKWDEEVYGREYDLDIYMIVAVDDFNMGAMENKGLNIFNSKYVLASEATATDTDYENIQGVVAHEYFHNWSGNRVTCRDWFQLSLKEGFTVFRDQEFSADMTSRGVKRIDDVNILRSHQFLEDASPMAHPVRPASYVEINNFYTSTVYNKGAEVVRMLYTLLGKERFRKGTDLYFSRHDGQGVTIEDFVAALVDANKSETDPIDLTQFMLWYNQAGTPLLKVKGTYDEKEKTYTLEVEQSCPPTPEQSEKKPFHIPFAVGLLGQDGAELPLKTSKDQGQAPTSRVLELREKNEKFVFTDVPHKPVPSILRGFSAPVKVEMGLTDEELGFLMAHDTDPFNKWEASQKLGISVLKKLVEEKQHNQENVGLDDVYQEAISRVLSQISDPALVARILTLPSFSYLSTFFNPIEPLAIQKVRKSSRKAIASTFQDRLLSIYETLAQEQKVYSAEQEAIGKRTLKNVCLGYLMELDSDIAKKLCLQQFLNADNMTDSVAALSALSSKDWAETDEALAQFYLKWKDNALVIDKWLTIQAVSDRADALQRVQALEKHEAFNIKNPNKVRSLLGAFSANPLGFHKTDGSGYAFISDHVIGLDAINPQVSAGLVKQFSRWKDFSQPHAELMKNELKKISQVENLSKNVYEIVSHSLQE